MIDSAVGGSLDSKTMEVAKKLIKNIAIRNYQWNSRGKQTSKIAGVLEVSKVTALVAQVEAMSKKIDSLLLLKVVTVMAF